MNEENKVYDVSIMLKSGHTIRSKYKSFTWERGRNGEITKMNWKHTDDAPIRLNVMDISEIVAIVTREVTV